MLLGGSWAHNCGEVAMLALLGDVLYWVGCGLAGFMVVAAIAVQKTPDRGPNRVIVLCMRALALLLLVAILFAAVDHRGNEAAPRLTFRVHR
jgi:hypothetical protein